MTLNLLDGLMASGALINGVKIPDLTTALRESRAFDEVDDLRGRVVVVQEPDAASTIGMMVAAWQREAVPMLSGGPADELPWWNSAPGSFLVPEEISSAWELPVECALVQATSGSSGTPRLAMRSHASFYWESQAYANAWGTGTHPLVHCVLLEHSLGIGITLSALLAGRDVVHERPVRANRLTDFGTRAGVIAGTPSTLRILNEALSDGSLGADTVFCGAGSLAPKFRKVLEQRWETQVIVGFGSTETGGVLSGTRGLGSPVPGASLADEPSTGSAEPFQLKVRLPHLVLGYVGRRDSTEVWEFPDLVRRGGDGQLEHVARITRTMRTRDQTRALGLLSDALSSMDRDWRLLEASEGDTASPQLLVEGEPLSASEEVRLRRAGGAVSSEIAIRTVPRFPRNDVGKVELAKLLTCQGTEGGGA
ncbi:AMP-binding protein [Actinoplanes sp. NPDC049668]|uniref:AMP-binding protein n=1 Tax=unclassified Actinoplanes TaxID=2626549 RepID=UPI0033A08710